MDLAASASPFPRAFATLAVFVCKRDMWNRHANTDQGEAGFLHLLDLLGFRITASR